MAKVLVRRESRNANSLDTPCRALASHIDKDADRRRFLAEAGWWSMRALRFSSAPAGSGRPDLAACGEAQQRHPQGRDGEHQRDPSLVHQPAGCAGAHRLPEEQ